MDTNSVGNQNPWAPYESYRRDCSQAICSIYCPQWCYVSLPPPPPFLIENGDDGSTLSPLIISIMCVLLSAFLLVCYYTIIRKYCRRSNNVNSIISTTNRNETNHDEWQDVAHSGLDDMLIKSITVFKYQKRDGLIEATECAVCLNEFQENENLRLLPKCTHAFHLPCIDTWLKTNTNCPLCRSSATPTITNTSTPATNRQASSTLSISSLRMQRQSDLVLVVEDGDDNVRRCVECTVSPGANRDPIIENIVRTRTDEEMMRRNGSITDQENGEHYMRSISISQGAFSSERRLLISHVLTSDEHDDKSQMGNVGSQEATISSSEDPVRKDRNLSRSHTSAECWMVHPPIRNVSWA